MLHSTSKSTIVIFLLIATGCGKKHNNHQQDEIVQSKASINEQIAPDLPVISPLHKSLRGHTGPILSVSFSSDGRFALSGAGQPCYTIRLWDVHLGREVSRHKTFNEELAHVCFGRENKEAFFADVSGNIQHWNFTTGLVSSSGSVSSIKLPSGTATHISLQQNPIGAFALRQTGRLQLFDLQSGKALYEVNAFVTNANCIKVDTTGKWGYVGDEVGQVQQWNLTSQKVERVFRPSSAKKVTSLSIADDGSRIVVTNWGDWTAFSAVDGKQISAASGPRQKKTNDTTVVANCSALSKNGSRLVIGYGDGTMRLWDITAGKLLRCFQADEVSVCSVALSPDSKMAITGGYQSLRLWDLEEGMEIRPFLADYEWIVCKVSSLQAINRTSKSPVYEAIAGVLDHAIRIWYDRHNRRADPIVLKGHQSRIVRMAISPDADFLVSGDESGVIYVWNAYTGKELGCLHGHASAVSALAISRDGKQVLSGSLDGTICWWDVTAKKEIRRFSGHQDQITALCLSTDETQALSASTDSTIRRWDVLSGRELQAYLGPRHVVAHLALAPDKQSYLVIGTRNPPSIHSASDGVASVDPAIWRERWVTNAAGVSGHTGTTTILVPVGR